jgi:hypothetical protein
LWQAISALPIATIIELEAAKNEAGEGLTSAEAFSLVREKRRDDNSQAQPETPSDSKDVRDLDTGETKMKTKMIFTWMICSTLSAFVICLSSSEGQTLGNEELMGTGYEPVVNCDRIVDPGNGNKRIQFVWMDLYSATPGIDWAISHKLGAPGSWTTVLFPGSSMLDPLATCDIWSTGTIREMYFGWDANPKNQYFQRSPSGTFVDQSSVMGSGDRPWLVANTASLYLSALGSVKHAAIPPSGSGFVDWSDSPVLVFTADPGTTLVGNFPVATHSDSAPPPNEQVFLLAREYASGASPGNIIRIRRANCEGEQCGSQGITWSADIVDVNVSGADGFPPARDGRMVTDHIACDPRTSVTPTRVYAFYVRNEMATWGRHNVLYCKASTDGGDTWGSEVMVYTISQSDLPPHGFAVVPPNSSGNTDGFYRIGRVWNCVDDNGYAYVTWMDNRYGEYRPGNVDTPEDYWHVFCARSTDQGQTWSTPIRVSGTSDPQGSASIGGYGNPFATESWIPPGDFLTCDADVNRLYVAWPDTRANQTNSGAFTNVYFRVVQF